MINNVHERLIPAPPDEVWAALTRLEELWPAGNGRFELPEGLYEGAPVIHSPWRYTVGVVEPGKRVWFSLPHVFSDGHGFTLTPVTGGTLVRHELRGVPRGMVKLLWPLIVRRQHDKVVELVLDNLADRIRSRHAA